MTTAARFQYKIRSLSPVFFLYSFTAFLWQGPDRVEIYSMVFRSVLGIVEEFILAHGISGSTRSFWACERVGRFVGRNVKCCRCDVEPFLMLSDAMNVLRSFDSKKQIHVGGCRPNWRGYFFFLMNCFHERGKGRDVQCKSKCITS